MPNGCSIRALWILNNQDFVVFSRRFPVVERRWRAVCKSENETSTDQNLKNTVSPFVPTDSELAVAFQDRKRSEVNRLIKLMVDKYKVLHIILLELVFCLVMEGSACGFGIRVSQSTEGLDSWVDDPIMRHIISLYINKEEEGENHLLWPLILHAKGHYFILVLPLVEPHHLKTYARICKRSDCGNAVGVDESLSSVLIDLPSITG
ncbi:unnamed protein product [Ilex paraguariensis]|uniref:Uncharacterized protein n=1 Tax=Ilex paraguariensis TaxID=185542 RepID=A0ABC8SXE9_9AQUA